MTLRHLITLVLAMGTSGLSFATFAADLASEKPLHLFLLVGQSNMAGRGRIAPEDQRPHPRVLTLTKDLQWQAAVAPLHFDKPKIVGTGLGGTFGREVARAYPDITVGLIPCAVGGSPIDSWKEGAFYTPTQSHPWDDAIRRARHAMQFGELRGILWHQGESDCKTDLAGAYEAKLHALINRFRQSLNAPYIPFIVGQMGQFAERPWDEHKLQVNQAHQTLPAKVLRTAFVPSDGLNHKGDEVHFDATGFREFGRRYFKRWLDLTLAENLPIENPLLPFTIERTIAREGFDETFCWVHARAGTIPPGTSGTQTTLPLTVMTLQKLQLSGSDVFYALNSMTTDNGGRSWTAPQRQDAFARQQLDQATEQTVCDFWPRWHRQTGTLLGTGQTVVYEDNRVKKIRSRATPYATYDPSTRRWSPWKTLKLPTAPRFENAGAGCSQRFDLPNGDILLPFYFKEPAATQYSVAVARCQFDGSTLRYLEHGTELTVPIKRGLYEPSVTGYGDRFFLTLRNDDRGYVTVSNDGLHYPEPKPWTFDDGTDLGSYNTQQHWVTHPDGLFLCYTRRNAGNDHVFRHRAPLFIARVDPEKLQVIRATEQILVPELGARLGNFGITTVNNDETWITVTEWMQTTGPNPYDATIPVTYGAKNRIWVVKLKWR